MASNAASSVLVCCGTHPSPRVLTHDDHHIVPKAWGGKDVQANLVAVCPNVHRLVHTLLNRYKKVGGIPPWSYRRQFGPYVRKLAQQGWDQMPPKVVATAAARRALPDL